MMTRGIAITASALAACVGAAQSPETDSEDAHWVRDIALSNTRGEVGRAFSSEVSWRDNYLTEVEFSVANLPPGLRFDAASKSIVGKPERDGFSTINVAIRKKVDREFRHKPVPDERWWRAEFELAIYKPIE